jgi:fumarylacetoacetase
MDSSVAMLDETHDPTRRSWVESANFHADFPIQNLPIGVFAPCDATPRAGIAIGDEILDLCAALECALFTGDAEYAAQAACGQALNTYLALTARHRRALRLQLSQLLTFGGNGRSRMLRAPRRLLYPARDCVLLLPASVGDYTDFVASLHHVERVSITAHPRTPVTDNFRFMPVAFHGRASTVQISGTAVRRPRGQFMRLGSRQPEFSYSEALDYEAEVGLWIGGESRSGEAESLHSAADRIAGMCLVNDWSARDLQRWEAPQVGAFASKNFLTSVSPWIVSAEALAPFRTPAAERAAGDPQPLEYLRDTEDQQQGAFDIEIETFLRTPAMATAGSEPQMIARSSLANLYWTPAQLVAHHTVNGCTLRPGDLVATGTVSGVDDSESGCLLELTRRGIEPLRLVNGEERAWLEDGDELILHGRCERDGFVGIGFGECRGRVSASPPR